MQITLAHNHYDANHLESVKREMMTLGAPTIKAVWMECWDTWVALEGCHRVRAAAELGLTPVIDEIEYDDETTVLELDLGFQDDFLVSEVVQRAYANQMFDFA